MYGMCVHKPAIAVHWVLLLSFRFRNMLAKSSSIGTIIPFLPLREDLSWYEGICRRVHTANTSTASFYFSGVRSINFALNFYTFHFVSVHVLVSLCVYGCGTLNRYAPQTIRCHKLHQITKNPVQKAFYRFEPTRFGEKRADRDSRILFNANKSTRVCLSLSLNVNSVSKVIQCFIVFLYIYCFGCDFCKSFGLISILMPELRLHASQANVW